MATFRINIPVCPSPGSCCDGRAHRKPTNYRRSKTLPTRHGWLSLAASKDGLEEPRLAMFQNGFNARYRAWRHRPPFGWGIWEMTAQDSRRPVGGPQVKLKEIHRVPAAHVLLPPPLLSSFLLSLHFVLLITTSTCASFSFPLRPSSLIPSLPEYPILVPLFTAPLRSLTCRTCCCLCLILTIQDPLLPHLKLNLQTENQPQISHHAFPNRNVRRHSGLRYQCCRKAPAVQAGRHAPRRSEPVPSRHQRLYPRGDCLWRWQHLL